jgi:alkylation response protein AidB-like acyl-CoA dehydrogenase
LLGTSFLRSCESTRARARLYAASLLVGVLRQAAEFSREYALEREAFGRPIAHHVDRGVACEAAAAAAFAEAVDASLLVGPNGVQILGGHGFVQDYPVEKYMRESRALGLVLGGLDAAREEAGRALCAAPSSASLSHVEGA